MDRQDFIALLSAEGQALLEKVGPLEAKTDVVQLVSKLRAGGSDPGLVATVLTQAKLRRQAKAKFGPFADRMLFTEAGLEQASRLNVAALHADRFRKAGIDDVADLGCGIGAESLALASLDIKVHAFEIDEVTAAIATYNLAPFDNAEVQQADVTEIDLSPFGALFLDPARRELGGPNRERATRKFDPAAFSPSFDFVLAAAAQKPTGVKFGPGHPHEGIPDDAEAQWVSVGGNLVELTLWFGSLARPNIKRSALLITADAKHEITSDSTERLDADLGELEEFVYEPDNAVIRSHLLGQLAQSIGAHIFSPEIAYLTAATEIKSPWLKGYRVLENLAFDRKKLKAYLRERGIGILEIKKRGSDVVPEELRKELAPKGKGAATLIVTRVGDAHRVLVCEALK
jgi:THUMP domain-like/Methyltransferase small domain